MGALFRVRSPRFSHHSLWLPAHVPEMEFWKAMNFAEKKINRRDMLKLGVLGGAALMLPLERSARTQLSIANRIPESQLPAPFQVPFAAPPVLRPVRRDAKTDYYRLAMQAKKVQILPGFPATTIYGYNGITPGPTIKVMQGTKSVVRQIKAMP